MPYNIHIKTKHLALFMVLLFVTACTTVTPQHKTLKQVVDDYFDVYAQRSDFDQFMTFYAEEAELIDIVYGNHLQSKNAINEFLDWNRGEFRLVSGQKILTVTQQTIEANTVVTQGYFHSFEYDGAMLGPWLFNITLEFDNAHKIVKQTDWINYTPRAEFLGGNNMNDKLIDKD